MDGFLAFLGLWLLANRLEEIGDRICKAIRGDGDE